MAKKSIDVRGEICPDPLTLAMKAMEGLSPGDLLEVTVDSPMALETISRWVQNAGHRVIGVEELGAAQWLITLEKLKI